MPIALYVVSARANDVADMSPFSQLPHATLNSEMVLHRRTYADFGINTADLEETEPALVTKAYASFLVKTSYEGTAPETSSVLILCGAGFG
jgi:thiaminase/transcriptional activator TenA